MDRFHRGVTNCSVPADCREADPHAQKPSRHSNVVFVLVFLLLPLAIAVGCAFAAAIPPTRKGQLTPSPGGINFGNVPVGGSGVSQIVTLTNSGRGRLNVLQASVTGAGFSISGLTLPMTLDPGQSGNFSVWFTPNAAGNASGSVSLTSDGGNSPTVIALSGSGLALRPQLTATPSSVSFGSVNVGSSSSLSVNVSNPGTADLIITAANATGNVFSTSLLTQPLDVPPGQNSNITVQFAPTSAGSVTGTLLLTSNTQGSPTSILLAGNGVAVAPRLGLNPASVAFGNVNVGSSALQNITLTNAGNANLTITQVNVTANSFSNSGLALPLTLTPNQSSSFAVAFVPTATGTVSGSILLVTNAPTSPTVVNLSGTGVAPAISVSPVSMAFGNVNVGSNLSQAVTVSNPGTANLVISNAAVSGTVFTLGALSQTTIAPNGSAPFTVQFAPTVTGLVTGSLTLTSNTPGSPTVVNLSGTGVAPAISIGPPSLAFGDVIVGGNSSLILTIQNPGNANLTITAANFTGSNFFALTSPLLPLTLTPNQSSNFSIQFAPTSAGGANGSLSIVNNALTTPTAVVPLSGNGVASASAISVSPTSLAFGSTSLGSTSTLNLTITNTGNADLTISAANFAGGSLFSAPGLSLPLTIPPAQSSNLTVQFAPTSGGSAIGSLALVSNAAASPPNVPLSGTGSQGHSVTLNWDPSTVAVSGYNVYRGMQSGGPYTELNSSLVLGITYIDNLIQAGQTYFYVVTALDSNNLESSFSNEISVTIPTP